MKPFRAVIVNSVVLSAVNTGEVRPNDFVVAVTGTALTQAGRRRFVDAFERRLSQETTHPVFRGARASASLKRCKDQRASWRGEAALRSRRPLRPRQVRVHRSGDPADVGSGGPSDERRLARGGIGVDRHDGPVFEHRLCSSSAKGGKSDCVMPLAHYAFRTRL